MPALEQLHTRVMVDELRMHSFRASMGLVQSDSGDPPFVYGGVGQLDRTIMRSNPYSRVGERGKNAAVPSRCIPQ